ncbi:dihydrodipicolinate synthase family protein [Jiangella mangrovi]|uniref:Dihydrodipicolinate synthase/N-acetylneuraminate lyase n=1 Tax=Jiangella mangrovi TaxID=1524084 RepID=A0A7W9LMC2_9ACTN|nr:dihydrodipicolinate synthase family protein [Jiangella mangrovi]MBB5789059.1 dihydrodipicolinate synthase/N-acetylneuraminate lyase [Jiangella mangrovi]
MTAALDRFRAGGVIPAHPLALDQDRKLDERRQRALSRYYVEAGATGLAVAVHTTQFAVHEPARGLLAPVLELAAETAAEYDGDRGDGVTRPVLVAGIVGPAEQAVAEAELARGLGYDLALLTPYGTGDATEDDLLDRAHAVGEVLPVIGFYLQPKVGGRVLGRDFWRRLAEQPAVAGFKIAPFDRYATLEVLHGVAASGRAGDVALYTGNDDHIVMDLVTTYETGGEQLEIVGGLLGQWSVWVRGAVETVELARKAKAGDDGALRRLLALNPVLTDANAVLFDAANGFHGCIPGLHEVLRRQGLLAGLWCLDEHETLSPGQEAEIDRIWAAYPELRDDDFIAARADGWLR